MTDRTALVPEAGLWLETDTFFPKAAERFPLLFRQSWSRLPEAVRTALADWWAQIRATEGHCLPCPNKDEVLESLPGLAWSAVPRIRLVDVLPGAGACCWFEGVQLDFNSQPVLECSDGYLEAIVAHEIAHIYIAARGRRQPAEASSGTWKRYLAQPGTGWEERLVNELIVAWGFMDTTHFKVRNRQFEAKMRRKYPDRRRRSQ